MSCLAWQVGAAGMQQDRWGDCCISSRCLAPGSRKGAGAVGRQRSTHLSPQGTHRAGGSAAPPPAAAGAS